MKGRALGHLHNECPSQGGGLARAPLALGFACCSCQTRAVVHGSGRGSSSLVICPHKAVAKASSSEPAVCGGRAEVSCLLFWLSAGAWLHLSRHGTNICIYAQ